MGVRTGFGPRLRLLLVGLACVGCGVLGDPAHLVVFENGLTEPVVVYEQGRAVPRFRRELAPGASVESSWLWPLDSGDRRIRRVEAATSDGVFIFCREFSFQDLEAIKWRLRIVREGCTTGGPP
jgi:hypothetical protein